MSLNTIAAVGVLVIPILGVFLLRYLRTRLTALPFYSIGGVIYGLAALFAILLVRAKVETVQLGNLVLTQPQGIDVQLPLEILTAQPPPPPPTTAPTSDSPTRTPTPAASRTATREPTARPTASPTPAATASPSPTAEPTAEPTEEPTEEPASESQTYTVQPGDTLRSIAEDFGVSVEDLIAANDLSPAEADALQPGDTLIIP